MLVNIKEPFYSAWQFYGWERGVVGIGIAEEIVMEALKNRQDIYVKLRKEHNIYIITPDKMIEVLKKYKSIRKVKFGKKVAVFPKNAFYTKQEAIL